MMFDRAAGLLGKLRVNALILDRNLRARRHSLEVRSTT